MEPMTARSMDASQILLNLGLFNLLFDSFLLLLPLLLLSLPSSHSRSPLESLFFLWMKTQIEQDTPDLAP